MYPEEKEFTYVGRKTLWVHGVMNLYFKPGDEVVEVPTGSGKDLYPGTIMELKNYLKPGRPYCEAQRSRVPNDAYFTGAYKVEIQRAAIEDDCVAYKIIQQPTILLNKTGENQFDVVKGLFDYNTIKTQPGKSIHCVLVTQQKKNSHTL